MLERKARVRHFMRRMASWRRNTKGAVAVEFALVMAPLLFLIFACLELAVVILLGISLENATNDAARRIRIGQSFTNSLSRADFITQVCDGMGLVQDTCRTDLLVDVKSYPTFAATAATTNPIVSGVFINANTGYNLGPASSIQMVKTYMPWTLITPFLSDALSQLNTGQALITSSVVFRNEPF
jgi:Flp pilus assembly protein TadG